ncbi:hypothetical protein CCUS01_16464 [Colletotrichum cuscutae]|uniref:Uncharacterized protein n=1 Tax=Colletotrichum cuscutae TaxID=1209917 RepID=A0AAI9VBP1_9PEZI|nr:hypothetical protein CCUS01_16464 [Colletotrichum cuscutae]
MWNDADAEEDAHQTASSRVVPPYHASFISSGQRTRSLSQESEEVSARWAGTRQLLRAMTYLRQLKSTFPLGPFRSQGQTYRSVWGHRVIGCRPANPLALANQSYPYRYSKPIPSHVRAAGSNRSTSYQFLGDRNVKREKSIVHGTSAPGSQSDSQNGITLCLGLFNPLVVTISTTRFISIATSFQAGLMALRRRPAERGNRVYRSPAGRQANAVEPHLRRAIIQTPGKPEAHQKARIKFWADARSSSLTPLPSFAGQNLQKTRKKTASERGSRWSFSSVDVSTEQLGEERLRERLGHQTIAWTVLETWAIFGFLQSPHRISIVSKLFDLLIAHVDDQLNLRRNPHVSWNPLSSVRIRDTNANLVVPNLGQDAAAAKVGSLCPGSRGPFLPLLLGKDAAPPPLQVRQASGRPNSPGVCQAKSLRHLNILCLKLGSCLLLVSCLFATQILFGKNQGRGILLGGDKAREGAPAHPVGRTKVGPAGTIAYAWGDLLAIRPAWAMPSTADGPVAMSFLRACFRVKPNSGLSRAAIREFFFVGKFEEAPEYTAKPYNTHLGIQATFNERG